MERITEKFVRVGGYFPSGKRKCREEGVGVKKQTGKYLSPRRSGGHWAAWLAHQFLKSSKDQY
ncbi:MAG: hypothetical protein ACTSQI_15710 [Candidatus Helarchaeota archaeon]